MKVVYGILFLTGLIINQYLQPKVDLPVGVKCILPEEYQAITPRDLLQVDSISHNTYYLSFKL